MTFVLYVGKKTFIKNKLSLIDYLFNQIEVLKLIMN